MSDEPTATLARPGLSRRDLNYFLLRRLHSLSGVIPIGAFLVEHFYSNYQAVGPGGEARFNSVVKELQTNPVIVFAEIFVIALPILFHAFYGIFIAGSSKPNNLGYRYGANWRYLLQRVTGIVLFFYIGYHVWNTRLAPLIHPSAFTDAHGLVTFKYMHIYLTETVLGVPTWVIYIIGVLAACFHFANGLWGFLIHWGLTVGPRAQRLSAYACAGLFVLLSALGLNSLVAFVVAT